jgi:hypothetical protein
MFYASGRFATKFSDVQNLASKNLGKKEQNQNFLIIIILTFRKDMCCSIQHTLLHS